MVALTAKCVHLVCEAKALVYQKTQYPRFREKQQNPCVQRRIIDANDVVNNGLDVV